MNIHRLTMRHDAAFRRKELCDNPEHLRANAESRLNIYRGSQRRSRVRMVIFVCLFGIAFYIALAVYLSRHFLP